MVTLQKLCQNYASVDCRDLGSRQLEELRNGLKAVLPEEICSWKQGCDYIALLRKLREAIEENDKLHGDKYPELLNSLLSVGEDGVYSNNMRFLFELIQNVDDCDFSSTNDCELDVKFDFNSGLIVLSYNETGFTPFNVFAITGIAEAAKNISLQKKEIGEKGIGFKSVFGVAEKVLIESGWFSFELYKQNFTIPIAAYTQTDFCQGTKMTLYLSPQETKDIYGQLKKEYCNQNALFGKNPLLFLNKLTKLKMENDCWRSMEFRVSRTAHVSDGLIDREENVCISIDLRDRENEIETKEKREIYGTRYTYDARYSQKAFQARNEKSAAICGKDGKTMQLQVIIPQVQYLAEVGNGALYSFLPTQMQFSVPIICHAPFKLDTSREFVHSQNENLWFSETSRFLSELLDFAYGDWCKTAGRDIIRYLPGASESLFCENNGKERCLSGQECFMGSHFLNLPLFFTVNHQYRSAEGIICFAPNEDIIDPETVYLLLDHQDELFIPPEGVNVSKFRFNIERDIYAKLFCRALENEEITEEALGYLDARKFLYTEDAIKKQNNLAFTSQQIETMMKHAKLAAALCEVSKNAISVGGRPSFTIQKSIPIKIGNAIGDEFEITEAPEQVERYLRFCEEKVVLLELEDARYLPCHNALVLSCKDKMASFTAFCAAVNPRDGFAARMNLKNASARLNGYDQSDHISPDDYMRELINIRKSIKDALGEKGYRSYIGSILKAGTYRERFIQELLQNADDCQYPEDVIPSFSLILQKDTIITEYNECGFEKHNVRALTAIGESTKEKLLGEEQDIIGEKGLGFKAVFAVASKVSIFSGDFNFCLTDRDPTIPRNVKPPSKKSQGTKMEIVLKGKPLALSYDKEDLLTLCLCLRKLKELTIDGQSIKIEDTGSQRQITIDKKSYFFQKIVRNFTVDDTQALLERGDGTKHIPAEQKIVCYVPEKNNKISEFYLYCGLPTKHQINIPLAMDAPFELTTSREEVNPSSDAWNSYVRREAYCAILDVMETLKTTRRARILKFVNYMPRRQGPAPVYVNSTFACDYLNEFDFLAFLGDKEIFPTYDKNIFTTPRSGDAARFSDAVNFLFRKGDFGPIAPRQAIDLGGNTYDPVLNALKCAQQVFDREYQILNQYIGTYIEDSSFREDLYENLKNVPSGFLNAIKNWAIIPVYGKRTDQTEYISWQDERIFVKKNAVKFVEGYYILNENLLTKADCEQIFHEHVNEVNAEWEQSRYNDALGRMIRNVDIEKVYFYLIAEFQKGSFEKYHSLGTLLGLKEVIPLRNQMGVIADTELFTCERPAEYFPVNLIRAITAHEECMPLARYLKCNELSTIHYENIQYKAKLTEDDVESLQDDYFNNSEEILREFQRDGLLTDALVAQYQLEYLSMSGIAEDEPVGDFPDAPVINAAALQAHVRKQLKNLARIVKVKVERTVDKGKTVDGTVFDLSAKDAREGVLSIYAPEGGRGKCFCQMCGKVKPHEWIEVNNIQAAPQYYLPQMRIALCLECSKYFESLRNNGEIASDFWAAICDAKITNQGQIEIPIKECKIKFTATHLAEIQELLRNMPKS